MSKEDFNILMQTVALAAWLGGDTRVASEHLFKQAIQITNSEQAWEIFQEANGPDVTNLAMNFYLKASEGHQRGFEFTHKSFGDYLAARAVLDFARGLPPLISRKVDHAMTDWVEATGSGRLTTEILSFLRDEVRARVTDGDCRDELERVASLKKSFEAFISTILADGLPACSPGGTWRTSENYQRNAEIASWAIINSLVLTLARFDHAEKHVRVTWPDPKRSLHHLLSRCIRPTDENSNPILGCFSYISAPRAYLLGLPLSFIDLRGSDMRKAVFSGSHLVGANLTEANLEGAFFERAMLDRADLRGANLKKATLIDARLDGINFEGSILDETFVSRLSLMFLGPDVVKRLATSFRLSSLSETEGRYGIAFKAGRQFNDLVRMVPVSDTLPYLRDDDEL